MAGTYTFTFPDGSEATVEGAADENAAYAAALKERDNQTRTSMTAPEDTVIPGLHVARAWQTTKDVAGAGLHGATYGWDDKASAGLDALAGNGSYADNLAQEKLRSHDRSARLNAVNPGSAETLDFLSGLAAPAGVAGKVGKIGNAGLRAAANIGLGAGVGGVSAAGHDQDPVTGALVGGGAGALAPLAEVGGYFAPRALGLGGAYVGSKLGTMFLPGEYGAWAGGGAGYAAGEGIGKGAQMLTRSPTGRDLLAKAVTIPATQTGPALDWWNQMNRR